MADKNLWTKLGLIVVLVGLSIWQIWPLEQKLKPGIDLGGGHSLLFEIDDSGLDSSQKTDLAQRVTSILKQRVDPQNNRNLVWRPTGWNRLEIQMPKPPEAQSKQRQALEKAREALLATTITEAQIRSALASPAEQRQAAFDRLVAGVEKRKELFAQLAKAENDYQRLKVEAATTQPAATQPGAASQPSLAELAKQADQAFVNRQKAIKDLVDTNLDVKMLGDIFELDKKNPVREKKLNDLKTTHPDFAQQIDTMKAANDEWAGQKGALDDPADLMRLLRGAGKLEFRILAEPDPANPSRTQCPSNPAYREDIKKYVEQLAKYGPRPREGDNFHWFEISKPDENSITKGYIVQDYLNIKYVLGHSTKDMGLINDGTNDWSLRGAFPGRDEQGRPAVNFQLDKRGGEKFSRLTRENIGRPLCIFLDNKAVSAATIRSEINTDGQISGNFSVEEVNYLVNTLDAGVLPARLKEVPLQQKSVGPALGATNRTRGLQSSIISLIIVIAFMTVYYTFNGVIANIALLMNLVITLGIMSFLQATFTLPGIAGLVLSVGMAVDANVLIYERMREELARGVSARMAVKLGYEKAFSAILDSNITTIITAVILASLGSEEIKGFGLTLGIALTISLFTALFVTRRYYNFMTAASLDAEETRKAWLATGILVAAGAVLMGLGWLFNASPQLRAESDFWGMGKFLMIMFATAAALVLSLYAFRGMYHVTGYYKNNRLPMLKLMTKTHIDWMGKVKVLWCCSAAIMIVGFATLLSIDKSQYLDIEFLGGTGVQVEIRQNRSEEFAQQGDEKILGFVTDEAKDNTPATSVGWLRHAADQIASATVMAKDQDQYQVTTTDKYTMDQMEALLLPTLEDYLVRGGIKPTDNGVILQFKSDKAKGVVTDAASCQARMIMAADYVRAAADKIRGARVQMVEEEVGGVMRRAFEIIVTETQKTLVAEALLASMRDILQVTPSIESKLVRDPELAPDGLFPIKQRDNSLADVIGGESTESVAEHKGGVVLVFDELNPPVTPVDMQQRLREMRLQPDFEEIGWRDAKVIGLVAASENAPTAGQTLYKRVAVVVNDPSLPYIENENNETWRSQVATKELTLAQAALNRSRSLQRVTQFAPQIANETVQKAIIAVVLSMIVIAIYVWVRFGSVDFGLGSIISLYHDVAITIACVMICHHLYKTPIGKFLLLDDFKFDLNMIAALLTIVGYSINDTIVIFDRIRENRGRLATVSSSLINTAVNETLSRTVITGFTTLLNLAVMYSIGGAGIHGFCFAMLIGIITGTYSSVFIASPMLFHPRIMWVTTILLGGGTAILVASAISVTWLKSIVMALIVIASVVVLIKQWAATSGGAAPVTVPVEK